MFRLIMSVLMTTMMTMGNAAFAEDSRLSQADFEAAIEKFGIDSAEAKIAAEHAMLVVKSGQVVESDEVLVSLPADFLEGSPY